MTETTRRIRLFLGSYAPLFALLAVRFTTAWLEIVCAVIAAAGLLDILWIIYGVARRTAAEPVTVAEVEDAGPEVAGYLVTYLLPFLTVAEPSARDLTAYIMFLLITGLVYVRSDMAQINPTLYLLGRRVVRLRTDGGWMGYVIVRSSVAKGAQLRAVPLNSAIRVEVVKRTANR